MSERDELAEIVYNWASGCDADGNVTKRASLRTADKAIAAGYRRIPDDCVVVIREDVEQAVDFWYPEAVKVQWWPITDEPALARLKAALTATRHGEGE